MPKFFVLSLSLALVLPVLGCGGGTDKFKAQRPKTAPASGVVTFNGNPLEGAIIVFAPQQGGTTAASCTSDSRGHFEAKAFPPDAGMVPGSYKVTVTKNAPEPEGPATPASHDQPVKPNNAKPTSLVPAKYSNPAQTPLTITIPDSGASDLKLELKDK